MITNRERLIALARLGFDRIGFNLIYRLNPETKVAVAVATSLVRRPLILTRHLQRHGHPLARTHTHIIVLLSL